MGLPLLSLGACPGKKGRPAKARKLDAAGVGVSLAKSSGELDPTQLATLEALCDRLIPADDDPGATEAGVARYIDAQLGYPPVQSFAPLVKHGLRQVDFISRKLHRRHFAQLSAKKRDHVLRFLQKSKRFGGRHTGQRFFTVMVALSLEGYLSDPVYGGNRGQVGWKLMGHQQQHPRPRRPYRGRQKG